MTITPDDLSADARARYDTWRAVGLTEAVAMLQLEQEGLIESDPFDAMVDLHRSLGLSEKGARLAAVGREHRGEGEARKALTEAGKARRKPVRKDDVARVVTALEKLTRGGKLGLKAAEARLRRMDATGEWSDVIGAAVESVAAGDHLDEARKSVKLGGR